MALLVNDQELCVCDIMAALELPQSTVSRHLSYLRNTGLVDDRRQGVWMYYKINRKKIEHAPDLCGLLKAMLLGAGQTVEDKRRIEEHLSTKATRTCG